jgi:uncharacterized protein
MMVDNRDDYIRYRFKRAVESFDEALIMADNKHWNAAINRLYYSCFYAVIAVLLKSNIESQTHDGARSQFSLHYIKTEKIERKYGKLFTKLHDYRQKGDYGDLYNFDEVMVKPLISEVQDFIKELEKFV